MNLFRKLQVLAPNPNKEVKDVVFQNTAGRATLTLAATPEQANKLILAQQYGTLNVTLCSSKDRDVGALAEGYRDLTVNKKDLLGLPEIPPVILPVAALPPIRKVVEIYHGTDVQQIVFNEVGELLSTEEATGAAVEAAPAAGQPRVAGTATEKPPKCKSCGGGKKPSINYRPAPTPAPTPAEAPVAPAGGGNTNLPTPAPTRATPPPTPDSP